MPLLEQSVAARFDTLNPTFDEKSRRHWAAAEALCVGRGGVSIVHRATGISRSAIHKGIKELEHPETLQESSDRTRSSGGGRKKTVETDPELRGDLEVLLEPVTRGDPESALRWTCKSLRTVSMTSPETRVGSM